jgi:ABC-2 type transport system permease protein
MKNLRTGIAYAKNSFKESFAYRIDYLFRIGGLFLIVFAQVFLWKALLGAKGEIATGAGNVTVRDMTTYVIVSTAMSTLISNNVIDLIDNRVNTGQIAMDLIRPASLRTLLFSTTIGRNIFSFLFILLPVTLVAVILFGFQPVSPLDGLLFTIALINGIVINFFISYGIGLIGFLVISIWHFRRFVSDLMNLFSGAWIPLWFFPGVLITISNYLPFQSMYYVPIRILIGNQDLSWQLSAIGQQLLWSGGLYVITALLWRGCVNKLVIQGG